MALFTAENAAEMGRRGAMATAEIKTRRKILSADPSHESAEADEFRKLRLVRVRKQLAKIDGMIEQETDPAKLDRLASAAIRLNEQERQLSGRSLPPTLKANAPTKPKRPAFGLPEPDPEPGDSPGLA